MSAVTRRRFLQAAGTLTAARLAARPADAQSRADDKPVKFRLGIVTYNIAADWDLATMLKLCKAVGLSPVELRTTHRHGVEPTLSKEQRKEVKQRFADAGIDIWGCGTTCEFQDPNAAVVKKQIETCKEFVQLVADVGGKGVKVRPNGLPKEVPVEKTLEQIGKALIPCGKAAADAGVEIWVEVHGRGTAHPPHMKTIMEQCGHPKVGVTWNSNADDLKDGSVAEYFKLLWPWLRSCHINELHSGYPYRELFRLLREAGYDRVTLAEIPGIPKDPSEKPKDQPSPASLAAAERLMRYYKALWTELTRA